MADFTRVASKSEIPSGEGRAFEVNGKTVAVFNAAGKFYAIENTCKHQGGPLAEGELDGCTVVCPWHGWTYDIQTGVCPDEDDAHVETFEVKVEGDDVLVKC